MNNKNDTSGLVTHIPGIALAWGWAGVIPFTALAGLTALAEPHIQAFALQILVPYSAIILTFMGGVHWGIIISRIQNGMYLYTTGIMPSLAAVLAILVPLDFAIAVLGVGFLALLLCDLWLVRTAVLPKWYGKLRIQLTLAVIVCLAVAGFTAPPEPGFDNYIIGQ